MSLTIEKMDEVVIVTVILTIIILALGMWYGLTRDTVDDEACRVSVENHARLMSFGLPTKNEDIHCPAKEITLSKNDDSRRLLAEDMKRCWKNYGKGDLNLFGTVIDKNGNVKEEEEGLFCSVCSIIEPKDNIKIKDFSDYLMKTKVKGGQETYMSYLTHYETTDANVLDQYGSVKKVDSIDGDTFTMSKDKAYATIFIYAKGEDYIKNYINIGKNVAAGLEGVTIGVGIIKVGILANAIPVVGTAAGWGLIAIGGAVSLGSITYAIVSGWIDDADAEWYSEVVLRDYSPDLLKKLNCTKIPVSLIDE